MCMCASVHVEQENGPQAQLPTALPNMLNRLVYQNQTGTPDETPASCLGRSAFVFT